VAGAIEGKIAVVLSGGQTEGEFKFDTEPNGPGEGLLDFDVRDRDVQIEPGRGG
jgi:hypothetical protein